ncbi:MAG: hypothetical protein M3275_04160 [Thermoproteota archaeon]|jgi:hypothetical protein|nr:hypothetical protein [Thermoproteota archaeon]
MTNMTSTITYMVILLFSLAMAIVVTAATTTTTAYAETAILTGIPKEISDALVSQTINRIQNYANNTSYINAPVISLTDEGVIAIVYNNNTITDSSDDIWMIAPHDYTPENGYTFRDNQIFKPDGSALFQ